MFNRFSHPRCRSIQPVQAPVQTRLGPGSGPTQCSGCLTGCSACSGVQHVFSVFRGVQSVQRCSASLGKQFRGCVKTNISNNLHRRLTKNSDKKYKSVVQGVFRGRIRSGTGEALNRLNWFNRFRCGSAGSGGVQESGCGSRFIRSREVEAGICC